MALTTATAAQLFVEAQVAGAGHLGLPSLMAVSPTLRVPSNE